MDFTFHITAIDVYQDLDRPVGQCVEIYRIKAARNMRCCKGEGDEWIQRCTEDLGQMSSYWSMVILKYMLTGKRVVGRLKRTI